MAWPTTTCPSAETANASLTKPSPTPPSRPSNCTPPPAFQTKASVPVPRPTTTDTSADVPRAINASAWSGTIAPGAAQRKAALPDAVCPWPTTTSPLAETPYAVLSNVPPRKSPRPTIPPARVHRKASEPTAESLRPTTADPSAEIARAELRNEPPAKSPNPVMLAASTGPAATANTTTANPKVTPDVEFNSMLPLFTVKDASDATSNPWRKFFPREDRS